MSSLKCRQTHPTLARKPECHGLSPRVKALGALTVLWCPLQCICLRLGSRGRGVAFGRVSLCNKTRLCTHGFRHLARKQSLERCLLTIMTISTGCNQATRGVLLPSSRPDPAELPEITAQPNATVVSSDCSRPKDASTVQAAVLTRM